MFLERISCILVAGGIEGENKGSSVEVFTGDLVTIQLPNLPSNILGSSAVLHNGTILLCGGRNNYQRCLQLDCGTWKEHSILNKERSLHSAVVTQTATFLFGGCDSKETYEYLPKDSTTWLMGKTKIPGGFRDGYAIASESGQEIWLIGGNETEKRIIKFDVSNHWFQFPLLLLNVGRRGHRCAIIPGTNKIMITGGIGISNVFLDSTEILDIAEEKVTMASPLNPKRVGHGIGIVTINGKEKMVAFGGFDDRRTLVDEVQVYNVQTEKWEASDIKLSEPKHNFGFASVTLKDIIPNF